MGRETISNQLRARIVRKWLRVYHLGVVAEHLEVSRMTVHRVIKLFLKRGDASLQPSIRGRPRILDHDAHEYLHLLIRQNPDLYLSELKALMEIFVGRRLSLTLIWNTLTRLGINHKQVGILGGFCSEFDVHPTTIH